MRMISGPVLAWLIGSPSLSAEGAYQVEVVSYQVEGESNVGPSA